jgi:hypothetical protein
MAHSDQESRQVLAVITHHGLVQLLVMNAIKQISIPWELFWDSTKEEVAAAVATREDELEATEEENASEDDYVNQEEPEEMEMEAKAFEEEVAPQEQDETMEPSEDVEVDTGRFTSTTAEAVPQEPTSHVELAEKFDSMTTTEAGSKQTGAGELVNVATEGTPQGPPITMESMEEDNQNEEEVVTTLTIEPMEEVLGELGHKVGAEPQESTSTLEPNIEDPCQFSFFSFIPRGARRIRSL